MVIPFFRVAIFNCGKLESFRKYLKVVKKMFKELHDYKEKGTPMNITYVVKKVGRKSMWGKIVQVDESDNVILFYDVDQKSVEQININQIDDIAISYGMTS